MDSPGYVKFMFRNPKKSQNIPNDPKYIPKDPSVNQIVN